MKLGELALKRFVRSRAGWDHAMSEEPSIPEFQMLPLDRRQEAIALLGRMALRQIRSATKGSSDDVRIDHGPTRQSLPEKICGQHRDRQAIVYIRQSTLQQVERNQESTRLQYALVDRAFALGWPREAIVVVDDDLGRSGASIEGRLGFQRLVAEVGLGRVGLVLGVEMSRLARSCRDWHQLLEICALFDTLIADADGVYDPANLTIGCCWA